MYKIIQLYVEKKVETFLSLKYLQRNKVHHPPYLYVQSRPNWVLQTPASRLCEADGTVSPRSDHSLGTEATRRQQHMLIQRSARWSWSCGYLWSVDTENKCRVSQSILKFQSSKQTIDPTIIPSPPPSPDSFVWAIDRWTHHLVDHDKHQPQLIEDHQHLEQSHEEEENVYAQQTSADHMRPWVGHKDTHAKPATQSRTMLGWITKQKQTRKWAWKEVVVKKE